MTKVKICGLMRPQDVQAAESADYLGFVVATGTRRSLEISQAKELMSLTCRPTIAVTTSSDGAFVTSIVSVLHPHAVQLNGAVDRKLIDEVRSKVGCEIWATVHVGTAMPLLDRTTLAAADRVVIDSASENGGGAGKVHDHHISAQLVRQLGSRTVLAGGLTPQNVTGAIAMVGPAMVDVSSGVETDGRKDPEKIARFIKAVRECR